MVNAGTLITLKNEGQFSGAGWLVRALCSSDSCRWVNKDTKGYCC